LRPSRTNPIAAPAITPDTGPSTSAQGNSHSTAQLGKTPPKLSHDGAAKLINGTNNPEATQIGWL
jgi:hypothetical protein